ncbi:MAG: hypothetical protein R3245_11805, partial [Kiloniellales bacterium]|nr:hypothetical protein [Kiloniellales bacterium]
MVDPLPSPPNTANGMPTGEGQEMGYRSVAYRKQVEAGASRAPVSIDDAIDRIKAMANVKADRSYKNGKKRKAIDQTVEIVMHLG